MKEIEAIKRFVTVSSTGDNKEILDLDGSVFMNFKRYTKLDVTNCFEADMRSSNFESVFQDEQEVSVISAIDGKLHFNQIRHF